MTDDLDRLLGPPPGGADDRLKVAILRRTTRAVGRRRWVRMAGKLTAAAGLFAAGVGVGWTGKADRVAFEHQWLEESAPPPEVVAVPVFVPVAPPSLPVVENPYLTADRLEQQAELAGPAEAARLYRLAGDTYLTAAAEPGQAARCYKLHLRHAGPAALAVEPADSWLLMSLKSQRKHEVNHVVDHGL